MFLTSQTANGPSWIPELKLTLMELKMEREAAAESYELSLQFRKKLCLQMWKD